MVLRGNIPLQGDFDTDNRAALPMNSNFPALQGGGRLWNPLLIPA